MIPDYKLQASGQLPLSPGSTNHKSIVSCRRDSCKYFQWADDEPNYSLHYQQSQPQLFMKAMNYQPRRPKLQRQSAVIEDVKKDMPPLHQTIDEDMDV